MGALPKKKISRRRRDNRRGHHALTPIALVSCPNCRQPVPAHRACPNCGQYRGREVIKVQAAS